MEPDEKQLTRDDFDSREDWLRYRWEAGLDPVDDLAEYSGVQGEGHYASLIRAIFGHTRRDYQRAWEAWGASRHVEFEDVTRVFRAIALANCRGCVMTTRLDITWSTLGLTSEITIRDYFKQFLDWLRRWLERNADWPAYVWAFEQGKRRGLHTHMLLYVPPELGTAFKLEAKRILSAIAKMPLLDTPDSETMLIQPRGPDVPTQWERFRYMMKGIQPGLGWRDPKDPAVVKMVAERTGIRPKDGGEMQGKRVGVSRELDHESYKQWADANELPAMTIDPWGGYLYGNHFLNWYIEHHETLVDPRQTRNGRAAQQTEPCDSE